MAQAWAKPFYNSKKWIECSKSYKQSVHHECERCGELGDELHHKILLTSHNINDPEITLNWEHLELLCFICHQRQTWGRDEATIDGIRFNKDGDIMHVAPLKTQPKRIL